MPPVREQDLVERAVPTVVGGAREYLRTALTLALILVGVVAVALAFAELTVLVLRASGRMHR
jgi:hypothetical protein